MLDDEGQKQALKPADNAWFVYSRAAGRISAAPANAKGWIALILGCGLTMGIAMLLVPPAMRIHPVVGFATLAGLIVGSVLLILRLAIARGRPAG